VTSFERGDLRIRTVVLSPWRSTNGRFRCPPRTWIRHEWSSITNTVSYVTNPRKVHTLVVKKSAANNARYWARKNVPHVIGRSRLGGMPCSSGSSRSSSGRLDGRGSRASCPMPPVGHPRSFGCGAFAQRTVCSGSACDGCGFGGGKPWCWSSRQGSFVGVAEDSVRAGSRRSGRRPGDHASIRKCEPSSGAGRGESSLGRSADARRAAETRNRRLVTHGVALSCQHPDGTITDLPYIFANHVGQVAYASPVMFCGAPDEDDGVDVCGVLPRSASASGERSSVCDQWSVVHWRLSLNAHPLTGGSARLTFITGDAKTQLWQGPHRRRRQSHVIRTHVGGGSIRPEPA